MKLTFNLATNTWVRRVKKRGLSVIEIRIRHAASTVCSKFSLTENAASALQLAIEAGAGYSPCKRLWDGGSGLNFWEVRPESNTSINRRITLMDGPTKYGFCFTSGLARTLARQIDQAITTIIVPKIVTATARRKTTTQKKTVKPKTPRQPRKSKAPQPVKKPMLERSIDEPSIVGLHRK